MAASWGREARVRDAAGGAHKRPRALVVAADAGTRRAWVQLLRADGLAASGVASAGEAFAAFADRAPDLVLLDLDSSTPGAGGDSCERILTLAVSTETPLIALAAQARYEAIARAFDAGASDFARKTEPPDLLLRRVRQLLRSRAQLAALRRSEARLRETQQLAQLASWRYDLETRRLTGGDELWGVLGTRRGELPRVSDSDRDALTARMRDCLSSGRIVTGELGIPSSDGSPRTLRYRMQLSLGAEGEPLALEGVVQEISAWRRVQERAEYLAEHDPISGLLNRAGLARELERLAASGARLGLVAIGIEGVARVAETLGRDAADELLREVARRLAAAGSGALLARTSEAQLALLAPLTRADEDVAALAARALAALDAPIRLATHEILAPAAAGIAYFPNDGADAASVLRSAERALAQARAGGPRIQTHSPATSAAALRRFTLASRLRAAIARGELLLHYQPKIALGTGEIVGFEGLVRWQEPELGLLAPGEFIPIAEESGLVSELGEFVLREACRQIATWREAGLGDVPVAVNLSPQQLRRDGVAARVGEILRAFDVPATLLGIEITESVLLDDAERAIRELRALRALGVELALDDFGTGFSSLSYLRKLPVQIVKIDRTFIAEIAAREDAAALTAQVVALAKALWLRVVAEGVEKEEERRLVAIWGCEEAQGFLFSAPLPADEAARLWRARGPRSSAAS